MKTMLGELTDATNMAQAFAIIPIIYSLGSFFGSVQLKTIAIVNDKLHTPVR
jgi:hypothetical protein